MGGDNVFKAGKASNHFLQFEERCRSSVAFVAQHHSSPLTVAHGSGPRVRNQINVHMFRRQLEHIVMSFFNPFFTLLARAFVNGFNHLDFPRFSKW